MGMRMRRVIVGLFPLLGLVGGAGSVAAEQLVLNSYGGPYEEIACFTKSGTRIPVIRGQRFQ